MVEAARSLLLAAPSDELLARAFNAAPNGFLLVDARGLIVAVNRELETMFAATTQALVGQPVEVLLPGALRDHHERLRQDFFARPERRAMGAGRVLHARRSDGHEFPVEIGLNPLSGPQGPLVLASVVDISERLALEWAFRGLFDASPYGLLIVDDDGVIAMANRVLGQSLGHAPADLVGQPLEMLLPHRHRAGHGELTRGYHGVGGSRMMGRGRDLTALHRDGTELPVEIGLSRVRWQRRQMTLAAVTDISHRKRLELQLRQAHANLEEFTYVASHDLRSPLRGIADLIEWIQSDLGSEAPAEVVRNLGRVSDRIHRMERLIDDLLAYARASSAGGDVTTIDLGALVQGLLDIEPVPSGITVELALAVAPFPGARTPLETVLRNLVGNAIKHHDRTDGRVRVTAHEDGGHCVICVIDDGPGIPETARARVFKLFQTLGSSRRGGSGIGLAVAKRLVEIHGGHIEVDSPIDGGRGACFRFWWPRFQRRGGDDG